VTKVVRAPRASGAPYRSRVKGKSQNRASQTFALTSEERRLQSAEMPDLARGSVLNRDSGRCRIFLQTEVCARD